MEEKFCLKWNDYQENTIKTFSKLQREEDFYDVTLVSDDQKQVMAHKVVLSSSSEYFKNILKMSKHVHPMICLTGITTMDLNNILDYIYQGEVQIFQENIEKFLDIAEKLKIDGLLSSDSNTEQTEDLFKQPMEMTKNEIAQKFEKSNEEIPVGDSSIAPYHTNSLYASSSVDEIEQRVTENLGKNKNGDYTCNLCGKVGGKLIRNMKNHIETHLEGISFSCSICGKQFRSRNSMISYKTRFHKSN